MFIIRAKVLGASYFYGPYPTWHAANAVVTQSEDRKGDNAPTMTILPLQNSDAFLVGSEARTYQGLTHFDRV